MNDFQCIIKNNNKIIHSIKYNKICYLNEC